MKYCLAIFSLFVQMSSFAQAATHDLIICTSNDGITWNNNALFEANAGVPSLTQHSTGVIYCAFQWFPPPNTPTNTAYDKIAIKQSSDGGLTWTPPQTVNFIGFPPTFKRPFDPTLVIADDGNIRMYFSSSRTGTLMALDSTVHSYSAISLDGINFTFEQGVRVAVADSITIDPAVVKLGSVWHYTCPRAAPQHGAHHFISNDGLAWTRTTSVLSDNNHNWTGNLMIDGSNIKFYGTPSPWTNSIWSKQSGNAYSWAPYVNCNGPITVNTIQADPSVLKLGSSNYIMVYVSKQTILGNTEGWKKNEKLIFYPNPTHDKLKFKTELKINTIELRDAQGKTVQLIFSPENEIVLPETKGFYFLFVTTEEGTLQSKITVE